ncbi:hypothetical protein BDW67DRAFT_188338 [Aspergillus spinulosporus]
MARDLRSRTVLSDFNCGKIRNWAVKGKKAKCRGAKTHQAELRGGNDQKSSDRKADDLQDTKQDGKDHKVKTQEPGDQKIQGQEGISLEILPSWPAQILPGITGEDLPIVSSRIRDSVLKYYVGLSDAPAPLIIRNLDWRENNTGEPERKPLENTRQLQAAFAQTHGDLARTPCAPCTSGKGPWKTCVAREYLPIGHKKPTDRNCANCLFDNREDCCLGLAEASASSRMRRSSAPSPNTPTHDYELRNRTPCALSSKRRKSQSNASDGESPAKVKRGRQRHTKAIDQSQPWPGSASPPSFPIIYADGGNPKEDSAMDRHPKTKLFRSITAPDEDGAELPFPLGADSWDNLPRLRRACSEMEHHVNVAKMRIWQLEHGKKGRPEDHNTVNPWDALL